MSMQLSPEATYCLSKLVELQQQVTSEGVDIMVSEMSTIKVALDNKVGELCRRLSNEKKALIRRIAEIFNTLKTRRQMMQTSICEHVGDWLYKCNSVKVICDDKSIATYYSVRDQQSGSTGQLKPEPYASTPPLTDSSASDKTVRQLHITWPSAVRSTI